MSRKCGGFKHSGVFAGSVADMEINLDDAAIERLAAEVAKSVEPTLNDAIRDADGLSLDAAVNLVHDRLEAAGVAPNDDHIREQLAELGFV